MLVWGTYGSQNIPLKITGNLFKAIIVFEDQETSLANVRIRFCALIKNQNLCWASHIGIKKYIYIYVCVCNLCVFHIYIYFN